MRSSLGQRTYIWTVVLWTILVIGHAAWFVVRAFEQLPTDEVYAQSVGFQVLAFGLTRLPFWLLGLLFLLVLETGILGRRSD